MPNATKVRKVEALAKAIDGKAIIFVDYSGINVADSNDIRAQLAEHGGSLKVFKNTLLKKAFEATKVEVLDDALKGMTAIAITDEEFFGSSGKVLLTAEKAKQVVIKGGYSQGKGVDSELVRKLGNLPSKEVLYQMLVGSLLGVVSNLVFALTGIAALKEKEGDKSSASESNSKETASIGDGSEEGPKKVASEAENKPSEAESKKPSEDN